MQIILFCMAYFMIDKIIRFLLDLWRARSASRASLVRGFCKGIKRLASSSTRPVGRNVGRSVGRFLRIPTEDSNPERGCHDRVVGCGFRSRTRHVNPGRCHSALLTAARSHRRRGISRAPIATERLCHVETLVELGTGRHTRHSQRAQYGPITLDNTRSTQVS
jgi:hypothetical protein